VVGAIPARYASTRLPGKPLLEIGGRPLIEHVWRRAIAAEGLDRVVVLTDDERIGRAVEAFGGEWEMTPAACASGTDRIATAARGWDAAAVVNIQGDEPLIDPRAIADVARHLTAVPGDLVVTLAAVAAPTDADDPDIVKVVVDGRGYALYFSRAPIPFPRAPEGAAPRRHLGIYGYRLEALLRLAGLPPSPLEVRESLEQLRALENGIPIRVLPAAGASVGVDTMADLERVEAMMRAEAPRR
jgi:3-deoxy-manno-octulosonate cytidylyltransferase (CMP-KDO synthetase)